MLITANTEMLLFRFNNYKKHSFIKQHRAVLEKYGYVWMLKIGKRSSIEKIQSIINNGGWLVLRSPKADGSISYIAKFTEISEEEPIEPIYPEYYNEILNIDDEDTDFYNPNAVYQWFKLEKIKELCEEDARNLVVSKTGKQVNEVIGTTRTAVMFIQNCKQITV